MKKNIRFFLKYAFFLYLFVTAVFFFVFCSLSGMAGRNNGFFNRFYLSDVILRGNRRRFRRGGILPVP